GIATVPVDAVSRGTLRRRGAGLSVAQLAGAGAAGVAVGVDAVEVRRAARRAGGRVSAKVGAAKDLAHGGASPDGRSVAEAWRGEHTRHADWRRALLRARQRSASPRAIADVRGAGCGVGGTIVLGVAAHRDWH